MERTISKSHLKNTTMYVNHVEKEYREKHFTFTWKLPSFFNQEKFAVYSNKVEGLDFNLNLKKYKDSFVVTVDTKEIETFLGISCSVLNNGFNILTFNDATQVLRNLYQFRFTPSDFKFLEACALNNSDTLELRFEMDSHSNENELYYSNQYTRDYKRFTELKDYKVVLKRFSTDFLLESEDGTKVYCPKSLLAARSRYFRNHFIRRNNNRNKMRLCSPTISLGTLIYFLYSGCLYSDNLRVILDIVKLAWQLDIPSLKTNCSSFIRPFLNSDSVHQIRKEGIKLGVTALVESADAFLTDKHAIKLEGPRKSRNKYMCRNAIKNIVPPK